MKEIIEIDHLIIGGGIVGLFVAKLLSEKFAKQSICLIDEGRSLGDQSSGRNSGVLHAGLYYEYGSLKHKLCLSGNKLWRDFAIKANFEIKNTGKYVFSNDEKQLDLLYQKSITNNVSLIDRRPIKEIADFVHAKYCFFSKMTSIIDVPQAIYSLERIVEDNGVIILKNHNISKIDRDDYYNVLLSDFTIKAQKLYNHGGLRSVEIRKSLGLTSLENNFIKGSYLKTSQMLKYSSLLYPVPDRNLLGLGIHSTIDLNGAIKFGPNIEPVTSIDYSMDENHLEGMKQSIAKSFKGVDLSRLHCDYAGIRSKIKYNGVFYSDFWIKSPIKNYYETCGIDSPGLTSAPAIAAKVLELSLLC